MWWKEKKRQTIEDVARHNEEPEEMGLHCGKTQQSPLREIVPSGGLSSPAEHEELSLSEM